MSPSSMQKLAAVVFALGISMLAGCAQHLRAQDAAPEIGFVEISSDMKLRRMIVRNPRPKGIVILLHGFPETLYAWKDISTALARDYEVHAFDWPGYGLSSRPPADTFSYSPKDYARVLGEYIRKTGIDSSKLVIYATDIGALPALLLALEEPKVARTIIVGDFAPFNRPQYMQENLQALKSKPSSELVRATLNKNRDEVLANAYRRGLPKEEQFDISPELKDDMLLGWNQGSMTSADAFYHYYAHFTRDQDYLESNLARLKTPVKVIWGEKDFYIKKEMGIEFAGKAKAQFSVLPNLGHYPHLQSPRQTIEEVQAAFAAASR